MAESSNIRLGFERGLGVIEIKPQRRFQHMYCVGKSGSGKSTLLLNIINQELDRCCIVIDPAGGFAEKVAALAPPERLIYISKENPLVINMLSRSGLNWSEIANEFAEAMNACVSATSSSPESSVLMNELIRNAVRVLMDDPFTRNIECMANLLNDYKERENYKTDKYWGGFDAFDKGSNNQYAFREKRDSAKRVATRLSMFYDNEIIRPFTVGPKALFKGVEHDDSRNQFDVAKFAKNKNIVVFNQKGFDNDSKIYLGILVVALVKSYYNHKKDYGGDPVYLYVDEFHRLCVPFWEEMLTQSRKYNVSINLAHQDQMQIEPRTLRSILGSIDTLVTFACGFEEAKTMGYEYGLPPETFKNLPDYEAYVKVGNKMQQIVAYPEPEIPDWIPPNIETEEVEPPSNATHRDFRGKGWIDQDRV